ncbi:MAG: glycosyltransferase [Pseudomonadales bacterium]|nr:glycosyltransferase [Pseudomonadales bacterium]
MSIDPVRGGGTAERTVEMSKALAGNGHATTILTLDIGITAARRAELEGVVVVALPCLSRRFYLPRPKLGVISSLVESADVVHLMGHWTLLNALVYFYIRKFDKTYVVCPAGALPLFGRSRRIKTIYNWIVGRNIIRKSDAQIVIAPSETTQFSEYGVSPEKIVWIPNGINISPLQARDDDAFRKRYGLGEFPFILYIGRLNPIKGPDLLLEAFAQVANEFPEAHLVIAGPDEGMQEQLEKTASDHAMADRIHFIGHISGETKSHALHAAQLMVIPSRQEAMSIVVLEAGIAGLPVLLTDRCGMNNLRDIGAGVVVPATVEGLRSGLRDLLRNPGKMASVGSNLQAHVYQNYLWTSIVTKFETLYRKLAGARATPA